MSADNALSKAWDSGFAAGVNADMGDWEHPPEEVVNPYRTETTTDAAERLWQAIDDGLIEGRLTREDCTAIAWLLTPARPETATEDAARVLRERALADEAETDALGDAALTDEQWDEWFQSHLTVSHFIDGQALGVEGSPKAIAQALADAGLLARPLPDRDEIARVAAANALTDFADGTRFPSDWILFRREDGSGVTVPDLLRETAANIRGGGGGR